MLPAGGAGVVALLVLEARFVTETKIRTPVGTLLNVAFRRVPKSASPGTAVAVVIPPTVAWL